MIRNRFNPLLAPVDEPKSSAGGNPGTATAPKSETGNESGNDSPDGDPEGGEGEGSDSTDGDEPPPTGEETKPEAATKTHLSAFERGKLRALGMGGLISRLETTEGQLAEANAQVAKLTAENTNLKAQLGKSQQETAAAAKGRENEVSRGVRAELDKVGLKEDAAPSQIAADGTPEALMEKFQSLKGAERTAFWREHKTALKAAEAAKTAK